MAAGCKPWVSPGRWGGMGPALGTQQRNRVSKRVLGGRHGDQSPPGAGSTAPLLGKRRARH